MKRCIASILVRKSFPASETTNSRNHVRVTTAMMIILTFRARGSKYVTLVTGKSAIGQFTTGSITYTSTGRRRIRISDFAPIQ